MPRHKDTILQGRLMLNGPCGYAGFQRYGGLIQHAIGLALFFIVVPAFACSQQPVYRNAENVESVLARSDMGFLGVLLESGLHGPQEQFATFNVLEIYKGPELSTVTVRNRIDNTCAASFAEAGTHYYVFGYFPEGSGELLIYGFSTSIPESLIQKLGFSIGSPQKQ